LKKTNIFMSIVVLALCTWLGFSASVASAEVLDSGSEKFYSANALYNKRLYSLAVEEYSAYLKQYPEHDKVEEARRGIALCYYVQGMWKDAERELKGVLKKGKAGDPQRLGLMHAQSLARLQRHADARAAYAAVTGSKDEKFRTTALAGVAESWYREKNWQELVGASDLLLKQKLSDALRKRGLYQSANAHFHLKQFDLAIPCLIELQPLVKGTSFEAQSAFMLAECYRETEQLTKAGECYAMAAKGVKGEVAAEVAYRLGLIDFRLKKYNEAVSALNKSIKLSEKGKFADTSRLMLGRAYIELKDYAQAEVLLKGLCQSDDQEEDSDQPGSGDAFSAPQAFLWYARVYSRQGKYDRAEQILGEAVKRFGSDSMIDDLRFDYANAMMVNRKYKEAGAAFKKLTSTAGYAQNADVLRLYAECLHRTKEYAESLRYADQYLKKYSKEADLPDVMFIKAENLHLLGKMDQALAVYTDVFTNYKESKNADSARFRAAQIHQRKGESVQAAELLAGLKTSRLDGVVFKQFDFVAGAAAFRQEKWQEALVLLKKFVDANKKGSKQQNVDAALVQMAVCSLNLKQVKDAVQYYEEVLSNYPDSRHLAMVQAELGRLKYEQGDIKQARSILAGFNKTHPDAQSWRPQVEYYLGWIALGDKQLVEAETHFKSVAEEFPQHKLAADAAMQFARVRLDQKKYAEAAKAYAVLIKKWPDHPQFALAAFSQGVAEARQQHWKDAAKEFKLVVDSHADAAIADRALYELAWCAKGLKQSDQAAQHYRKLISDYPQSALVDKVRTELAELTFAKADYDAVITELKETITKLSDVRLLEESRYRLGTAYFNKADYENAAAVFEDFIVKYPQSGKLTSVLFHAGESRMQLKEILKARDHFVQARELDGQPQMRESIQMRVGETQRLTRQYAEAAKSYKDFIRLFPDSKWMAQADFDLGWCLEKQGDYQPALECYRKVLTKGQRDELAARSQFQLGECFFAMKEYGNAIQELVKVTVAYPQKNWQARAALEIGRVLEVRGDKDKALDQFKDVITKYPDDQTVVDAARKHMTELRHGG